jgi:hypothetical protein
LELAVEEQQVL